MRTETINRKNVITILAVDPRDAASTFISLEFAGKAACRKAVIDRTLRDLTSRGLRPLLVRPVPALAME